MCRALQLLQSYCQAHLREGLLEIVVLDTLTSQRVNTIGNRS